MTRSCTLSLAQSGPPASRASQPSTSQVDSFSGLPEHLDDAAVVEEPDKRDGKMTSVAHTKQAVFRNPSELVI